MTTTTVDKNAAPAGIDYPDKPEGPIAAAIIAAGIGALVLGLVTTLSEASKSAADFFAWSDRVGPLSGKTIVTVIAWLVAWAILHLFYRTRPTRPDELSRSDSS